MFHVPERYRITSGSMWSDSSHGNNGAFSIKLPTVKLFAIASDGMGWEHVSVTIDGRHSCTGHTIPTWYHMCVIKSLFWDEEDAVFQFHPPKSQYINCHPGCLHLWRPIGVKVPLPPSALVGVDSMLAGAKTW